MTPAAPLSPTDVLSQVAQALPRACRRDVIVIGSLAAGYYFFADDGDKAIRTKDVDCMFSPHAKAVVTATRVTEALLSANWKQREDGAWSRPGTADTAMHNLPLVRLKPPKGSEWFIELLGAPGDWTRDAPAKEFRRVTTSAGDFAICSFRFLGVTEHQPVATKLGIRIARPSMMALANMLHHTAIAPETIHGTRWKRANKDLGRVVALAYLTVARDRRTGGTELESWPTTMWAALRSRFATQAAALAESAGDGVRGLLASPEDLDQSLEIANLGLLASLDVDRAAFAATGRRLVDEVIEPLAALARVRSR